MLRPSDAGGVTFTYLASRQHACRAALSSLASPPNRSTCIALTSLHCGPRGLVHLRGVAPALRCLLPLSPCFCRCRCRSWTRQGVVRDPPRPPWHPRKVLGTRQ